MLIINCLEDERFGVLLQDWNHHIKLRPWNVEVNRNIKYKMGSYGRPANRKMKEGTGITKYIRMTRPQSVW